MSEWSMSIGKVVMYLEIVRAATNERKILILDGKHEKGLGLTPKQFKDLMKIGRELEEFLYEEPEDEDERPPRCGCKKHKKAAVDNDDDEEPDDEE